MRFQKIGITAAWQRRCIGSSFTKTTQYFMNKLVEGRSSRRRERTQRIAPMNIGSSKSRSVSAHNFNLLSRARLLLLASALVITTFIATSRFDRPCGGTIRDLAGTRSELGLVGDGSVIWPVRGFGRELWLRIYVYDEKEVDGLDLLMRGRDGKIVEESCLKGQWGTQVKIHKMLLKSRFRTRKKEEADLFFVPTYTKCVRMMGGLNDKEINQTYVKVLSQMPYFRLSAGRDHVFVFPSGAGAHLFRSWAVYLNRSIILTPEGDQTDKRDMSAFNTWKDIIIPGNVDDAMTGKTGNIVEPLPISKRKYLANFLGRAQGKVGRLKLIELAKSFPDKLECPELKFSGPDKLGKKEYFQHLRNSKFCLAPRGESSWTLRFYESFFVECVPVILSDEVELPFQDVIDYTQISIKWPSSSIGIQLLDYLESIPDKNIEEMIARGRLVRCLFAYNSEAEPCSAFHGILWELQRRVRKFHQSKETFWLHNQTIVNRNLIPFHNWKPPMPLP